MPGSVIRCSSVASSCRLLARKRDLAALVQTADGATGPAIDARDIDALLAPVSETSEI